MLTLLKLSHIVADSFVGLGRQLTYKSIPEQLHQLEQDLKLFRFSPRTRGPLKRRLYMTEQANRDYSNPQSAANQMPYPKGFIEAAMVRWVSGGRVFTDDKGKPRFLKELNPPPCGDVWEIKVFEPRPEVRLIGGFLEQDTLVLTRFRTRSFLGSKGSAAWDEAMRDCVSTFTELFGHGPFHAQRVGDYISENFDDFPLKR